MTPRHGNTTLFTSDDTHDASDSRHHQPESHIVRRTVHTTELPQLTADALNAGNTPKAQVLALLSIAAELRELRRVYAQLDTPVPYTLTQRARDLLEAPFT